MRRLLSLSLLAVCGAASAYDFDYTANGQVPLADLGSATLDLPVVDARLIATLEVGVIVTHTWQGDVNLLIRDPLGLSHALTSRPGQPQTTFGFSDDDFGNSATGGEMFFTDLGASIYDDPPVPAPGINQVTGNWLAEGGSLNAAFAGRSLNGTWHLDANDNAGGDVGTLLRVHIRGTVRPVPEPASMAVLGLGAVALLRRRLRK